VTFAQDIKHMAGGIERFVVCYVDYVFTADDGILFSVFRVICLYCCSDSTKAGSSYC